MLGHPPAEWQADAQLFWRRLHPDDVDHVREAFSHTARTHENLDCEYRMTKSDGSILTIQQRGTVVPDADGTGLYLQGYMLDVSERRALEEQLRLAQKLESVGQLAAGIAHEINTPIQFVAGSVAFVSDGVGDLFDLIDAYRSAIAAAEVDAAVVERVREAEDVADLDYLRERLPAAFDRATAGLERVATIVRTMKTSRTREPRATQTWTSTSPCRARSKAAGPAIAIWRTSRPTSATLPPVPADGGELNQVFVNLIGNAAHAIAGVVEATDDRGTIRVSSRHEGNEVVVRIGDTGGGIPDDVCTADLRPVLHDEGGRLRHRPGTRDRALDHRRAPRWDDHRGQHAGGRNDLRDPSARHRDGVSGT